jgi:hypothetical protein
MKLVRPDGLLSTLLLSERFGHRGARAIASAGKPAMKYITGCLPRKRFAIRLRRKLLRLLTHSAMELNPEIAVALSARKYISALVAPVLNATRSY